MKSCPNTPPNAPKARLSRLAYSDPLNRAVEAAYRAYDRPAPRHAPGCGCALCADRAQARALAHRAARDWEAEDVQAWFGRAIQTEQGRNGIKVASRTDRAVFRFLLPRVLELLATATLQPDGVTSKAFLQFEPGRVSAGPEGAALMPRFAALMVDRALHDPNWPLDLISTLRLLACGGWALPVLVQQAHIDPDLPAALARVWGRLGRDDSLLEGLWPPGAADVVRSAFVTPALVERMMNFAMADGTSHEETDAAMRASDMLLRNL